MRAFAYLGMIHIAYLDEFGHVVPYVSRGDPRHNDSPVFGFAGFLVPAEEVRAFGTWFFQRKCELLFCREDCDPAARFLLAFDEHPSRHAAAADRAALPPREPPLPDGAGRRLDRRSGGAPGCVLDGAGRVAGERGVPTLLRGSAGRRSGQKRYPPRLKRNSDGGAATKTELGDGRVDVESAAVGAKVQGSFGNGHPRGRRIAFPGAAGLSGPGRLANQGWRVWDQLWRWGEWPVLFVCGAEHAVPVRRLFKRVGVHATIICADFDPGSRPG